MGLRQTVRGIYFECRHADDGCSSLLIWCGRRPRQGFATESVATVQRCVVARSSNSGTGRTPGTDCPGPSSAQRSASFNRASSRWVLRVRSLKRQLSRGLPGVYEAVISGHREPQSFRCRLARVGSSGRQARAEARGACRGLRPARSWRSPSACRGAPAAPRD
jgi:hypothetical protein